MEKDIVIAVALILVSNMMLAYTYEKTKNKFWMRWFIANNILLTITVMLLIALITLRVFG